MKFTLFFTQSLPLVCAFTALQESVSQAQEGNRHFTARTIHGNKQPIPESEVFKTNHPESDTKMTLEQYLAIEESKKKFEEHRLQHPLPTDIHPDVVLHNRNSPLNALEKDTLIRARTTAISDSIDKHGEI
jgi:hypothetical protein